MTEQFIIINNDIVFHFERHTKKTSLHNKILKADAEENV